MSAAVPSAATATAPSPVLDSGFWMVGSGFWVPTQTPRNQKGRLLCKQCPVWLCCFFGAAASSWMQNATGQKQQPASQPSRQHVTDPRAGAEEGGKFG